MADGARTAKWRSDMAKRQAAMPSTVHAGFAERSVRGFVALDVEMLDRK